LHEVLRVIICVSKFSGLECQQEHSPGQNELKSGNQGRTKGMKKVLASICLLVTISAAQTPQTVDDLITTTSPAVDPRSAIYAGGAHCDGTTLNDDTAAIQAAINAVPPGGTFLWPPSGLCYITSGLSVSKPVSFAGTGWGSGLLVASSLSAFTDVIHVYNPSSPIQGLRFKDFAIVPASGRPARYGIYFDAQKGTNVISNFVIDHMSIRQFGSAGIGFQGPTPPAFDGIFTSSITHSSIYGGLNLQNAGDSLTITGNTITGIGTITVNLLGLGSNTAHGFNFFFNNVTCTGGINVINAWRGSISYNNIELYPGATGTNGAVINLEGNPTLPPESFEVRGNYIGPGGGVPDSIRVNYMKGTRIEGNMLPRGNGHVVVTTPNADRTQVYWNREQPYGELIPTWLSDQGTNTDVDLIDPNTGKHTFNNQINFNTGISIGGGTLLGTTNQTGNGNLVLSNSPIINRPTLNAPIFSGDAAGSLNSLSVGGGNAITRAEPLCTGPIRPQRINGRTCMEMTFVIAGCSSLATGDTVLVNQSSASTSLAFPVGDWRVAAPGVLAHSYCNATAVPLTPTPQTINVWRFR
jgi:hypothetical protein